MVRRAEAKDTEAVLGLAKEFATSFVIDEAAFRASFEALLFATNTLLLVSQVEEQVVGYVLAFSHQTFYANGRVAWVEELVVDAKYRKQGIGKALMHSVEAWAANQGCKLVALATRRAASFYEAVGYQVSATYFKKNL